MSATMAEPKGSRASIQKRLRNIDKVRADYLAAVADVQDAKKLVDAFEKPEGYVDKFQSRADELARELNWLLNTGKQSLINGCRDEGLKTQFQFASQRRKQAAGAQETAKRNLDNEVERHKKLRDRIANGNGDGSSRHGEPAVIGKNGMLPWAGLAGVVRSLVTTAVPSWGISEDGLTIYFGPEFHESTADFLRREWRGCVTSLQVAQMSFDEATKARDEAEKALDAARDSLVWSEV